MVARDQFLSEALGDLGVGGVITLDELELDALRQLLLVQLKIEIERLPALVRRLRDKPGVTVD